MLPVTVWDVASFNNCRTVLPVTVRGVPSLDFGSESKALKMCFPTGKSGGISFLAFLEGVSGNDVMVAKNSAGEKRTKPMQEKNGEHEV